MKLCKCKDSTKYHLIHMRIWKRNGGGEVFQAHQADWNFHWLYHNYWKLFNLRISLCERCFNWFTLNHFNKTKALVPFVIRDKYIKTRPKSFLFSKFFSLPLSLLEDSLKTAWRPASSLDYFITYCISPYSFHRNNSFLNLEIRRLHYYSTSIFYELVFTIDSN